VRRVLVAVALVVGAATTGMAGVRPAQAQPGEAAWSIAFLGNWNYSPGFSGVNTTAQAITGSATAVGVREGVSGPNPLGAAADVNQGSCSFNGGSSGGESVLLGQGHMQGACSTTVLLCLPGGCAFSSTVTFSAQYVRVGTEMALLGTCTVTAGGTAGTGTLVGAVQMVPTDTSPTVIQGFAVAGDVTCAFARTS